MALFGRECAIFAVSLCTKSMKKIIVHAPLMAIWASRINDRSWQNESHIFDSQWSQGNPNRYNCEHPNKSEAVPDARNR